MSCPTCGATSGQCRTKSGQVTKRHKARPADPPAPSRVAYQPGCKPEVEPPAVSSTLEDAQRYVTMVESFGWTQDPLTPMEWLKLVIDDYITDLDTALEARAETDADDLASMTEERDDALKEAEQSAATAEDYRCKFDALDALVAKMRPVYDAARLWRAEAIGERTSYDLRLEAAIAESE